MPSSEFSEWMAYFQYKEEPQRQAELNQRCQDNLNRRKRKKR